MCGKKGYFYLLLIACFVSQCMAQIDSNYRVMVKGIKYFHEPLLFKKNIYVKKDSTDIYVKMDILMTESKYFEENFKSFSNMDSVLFDTNCFIYQNTFPTFVTDYILYHVVDNLYDSLLKQTYPNHIIPFHIDLGKIKTLESFKTQLLFHHLFLIIEMPIGYYNYIEKRISPPRYIYSRERIDFERKINVAIPLKENNYDTSKIK